MFILTSRAAVILTEVKRKTTKYSVSEKPENLSEFLTTFWNEHKNMFINIAFNLFINQIKYNYSIGNKNLFPNGEV